MTRPTLEQVTKTQENPVEEETLGASDTSSEEYQQGFAIISFITLLNASLAPVWHTVFADGGPPPLFLNAVVSVVALIGLLTLGPLLDRNVDSMSALAESNEEKWSMKSFRGGMELGVWKGLGKNRHNFFVVFAGRHQLPNMCSVTSLYRYNLSYFWHVAYHRQPRSLFAPIDNTYCSHLAKLSR